MPQRLRLSRRAFLQLLVGLVGAVGVYDLIELGWLEITRVTLTLPNLPPAFNGLTIAQISDLHLGPLVGIERVREALRAARALHADVIIMTGDFVSRSTSGELDVLQPELAQMRAPEGVVAVLGNWDWWGNARKVTRALQTAGITVLRNENTVLQRGSEKLYIAGVDSYMFNAADLPLAMHTIPPNAPTLLLAHEPDFADFAMQDARVLAQFSGHTHGGQVRVPLIGPILLPYRGRKYPEGLRQVGDLWLYTNRGIGVTRLPVRLNCRPEITLFTLTG